MTSEFNKKLSITNHGKLFKLFQKASINFNLDTLYNATDKPFNSFVITLSGFP